MSARNYSNTATPNALAGSINNTDAVTSTPLQNTLTGWPSSTPFTAVLDRGTAAEEVVLVTAVSGANVTFTRGYDGTAKVSHQNLAPFEHCATAIDYREANNHVNASQQVHGLNPGSTVVGTTDAQTLTSKTLDTPTVANLTNMQHDHSTPSKAGNIPQSAVTGLTAALAAKEDASAHATDVAATNASVTALSGTVSTNDGLAVHKAGTETITGAKTFSGGASVAGLTASGASNVVTTPGQTGLKKAFITQTVSFTAQAASSQAINWSSAGFASILMVQVTVIGGSSVPITARMDAGFNTTGGTAYVFTTGGNVTGTFTLHVEVTGT
jgi:hypothetical protein